MLYRQLFIYEISENLTFFAKTVKDKSIDFSLNDDNIFAEDFLSRVINIIECAEYKNLNTKEKKNYPGIDLGDKKQGIAIQVTSDPSIGKIKDAIKTFEEKEYYIEYPRLVVLIIGDKKEYRTSPKSKKFTFEIDNDVWDTAYLKSKIRDLTSKQLKELRDLLNDELTPLLNVSINAFDLIDEDIELLINVLYEKMLGKSLSVGRVKTFKVPKRTENFMELKNSVNNIDDTFFEDEIVPSIEDSSKIKDFLSEHANKEARRRYFEVTDYIREKYKSKDGIEECFRDVYELVETDYDNRHIDKRKLLILLHNMYFYCDIGKNPIV